MGRKNAETYLTYESPLKRRIVIEHCKQYKSFKTKAWKLKKALEKYVKVATVVVNPEEPRKGCFEVRREDGKVFISLLDMEKPFKPMKGLNIMDLVYEIKEG